MVRDRFKLIAVLILWIEYKGVCVARWVVVTLLFQAVYPCGLKQDHNNGLGVQKWGPAPKWIRLARAREDSKSSEQSWGRRLENIIAFLDGSVWCWIPHHVTRF